MSNLGLDLKLAPAPRGRRPHSQSAAKVRDLTEADIDVLWETPPGGIKSEPSTLLKIRNTHHKLAELLAQGVKQVEISSITGYSQSYISTIQNDPAFQNLVSYYEKQTEALFVDRAERMASLHTLSTEILQERLTEDPESFTQRELIELMKEVSDRTGHGPQSRSVNVNVNVDLAARLASARARVEGSEGSPKEPALLSGPSSSSMPDSTGLSLEDLEDASS